MIIVFFFYLEHIAQINQTYNPYNANRVGLAATGFLLP